MSLNLWLFHVPRLDNPALPMVPFLCSLPCPPLFFLSPSFFFFSTLKDQLPVLSTGSRASTPLNKEADSIRAKLEELGEDAAEVST